jgi:hypothetical protein
VHGQCWIADADSGALVSGRPGHPAWFWEFWDLVLDGPAAQPWRLAPGPLPTGLLPGRVTSGFESTPQYQQRTGAAGSPPPPVSTVPDEPPARPFALTVHYATDGGPAGEVAVTARLQARPSPASAVRLLLPAVLAELAVPGGAGPWSPVLTRLGVRELLG